MKRISMFLFIALLLGCNPSKPVNSKPDRWEEIKYLTEKDMPSGYKLQYNPSLSKWRCIRSGDSDCCSNPYENKQQAFLWAIQVDEESKKKEREYALKLEKFLSEHDWHDYTETQD